MTDNPDNPKIIIDEDWKSQVQAEKEKAKTNTDATQPSDRPTDDFAEEFKPAPASSNRPLPPASLTFLCTTIATEAMMALGQMANPLTGKTELNLPQAKHFVDTLAMLDEKTKGNRTPEETGLLSELLHQLRMAYVISSR